MLLELETARRECRDHDPRHLEDCARSLDRASDALDPRRRAYRDVIAAASLLRRLADDLRLVERFMRDAHLLAPEDVNDDDDNRAA